MNINLVASCTSSKRLSTDSLEFHRLRRGDSLAVAAEWLERCRSGDVRATPSALYAGGAWNLSIKSRELAAEFGEVRFSVISAGFGLVSSEEALPGYSATFAPGLDRVGNRLTDSGTMGERHRRWWKAINATRSGEAAPLSRLQSADLCLIVCGSDYIGAIRDDISELAGMCGPQQLVVVSVGIRPSTVEGPLRACLLPVPITYERVDPGPRATINQRVALWVIRTIKQKGRWQRDELETALRDSLSTQPSESPRLMRRKPIPEEIESFIKERLMVDPGASASRLLREFRDSGLQCEQSRFTEQVNRVRPTITEGVVM